MRVRVAFASLTLLLCLSASACRGGSGRARSFAVDRVTEGGPATVRLKVDRTAITVAESVLVVLEADLRDGASAVLPESIPPGAAGSNRFTVVDSGEERRQSGDAVRLSRWFRLEPYLSGDYAVEPLSVEVTDSRGARRILRTERVGVKVSSLLPKDYERLDIADIEGLLRTPWSPPPWLWIVAGLLAAAGAGTGAWLWWQRRLEARAESPARPAHEIAYEEIDALVAEELLRRGEVKLFYQRVTAILRKYIERRFGLRAPERTTEEFLYELRETAVLSDELKRLLRTFLEHCDLVKFAQLRPPEQEIRRTLESCRDFVRATELAAEPPGGTTGAV